MRVQATVAVRFCPRLFARSQPTEECRFPGQAELPYKMMFAVATFDTVILYSTEVEPDQRDAASSSATYALLELSASALDLTMIPDSICICHLGSLLPCFMPKNRAPWSCRLGHVSFRSKVLTKRTSPSLPYSVWPGSCPFPSLLFVSIGDPVHQMITADKLWDACLHAHGKAL